MDCSSNIATIDAISVGSIGSAINGLACLNLFNIVAFELTDVKPPNHSAEKLHLSLTTTSNHWSIAAIPLVK